MRSEKQLTEKDLLKKYNLINTNREMKVLKENTVPKDTVICKSCGSVLEYTNGDLYEDFNQPDFTISSSGHTFKNYHVHCPVCGYDTPASWVNRKEKSVTEIKEGNLYMCLEDIGGYDSFTKGKIYPSLNDNALINDNRIEVMVRPSNYFRIATEQEIKIQIEELRKLEELNKD